jgi:hypothetical protein
VQVWFWLIFVNCNIAHTIIFTHNLQLGVSEECVIGGEIRVYDSSSLPRVAFCTDSSLCQKHILVFFIWTGEFAGENSSLCVNNFKCFSAGNHKVFRTTEEAWDSKLNIYCILLSLGSCRFTPNLRGAFNFIKYLCQLHQLGLN